MSNNKIMTAEEFFNSYSSLYSFEEGDGLYLVDKEDFIEALTTYTKIHVKLALEAASKIPVKSEKKSQFGKYRKWQKVREDEEVDLFSYTMKFYSDKDSISNAYPETNIK